MMTISIKWLKGIWVQCSRVVLGARKRNQERESLEQRASSNNLDKDWMKKEQEIKLIMSNLREMRIEMKKI